MVRLTAASFAGEVARSASSTSSCARRPTSATAKRLRAGAARAVRRLARADRRPAGERVRGDPRLPPRAGVPLPLRARPGGRRRPGARRPRRRPSRRGRAPCQRPRGRQGRRQPAPRARPRFFPQNSLERLELHAHSRVRSRPDGDDARGPGDQHGAVRARRRARRASGSRRTGSCTRHRTRSSTTRPAARAPSRGRGRLSRGDRDVRRSSATKPGSRRANGVSPSCSGLAASSAQSIALLEEAFAYASRAGDPSTLRAVTFSLSNDLPRRPHAGRCGDRRCESPARSESRRPGAGGRDLEHHRAPHGDGGPIRRGPCAGGGGGAGARQGLGRERLVGLARPRGRGDGSCTETAKVPSRPGSRSGVPIRSKTGRPRGSRSNACYALASICCDEGRWAEAEEYARHYRATSPNDRLEARLAAHRGDFDRARSLAQAVVDRSERSDSPNGRAGAWTTLAEVERAAGQHRTRRTPPPQPPSPSSSRKGTSPPPSSSGPRHLRSPRRDEMIRRGRLMSAGIVPQTTGSGCSGGHPWPALACLAGSGRRSKRALP